MSVNAKIILGCLIPGLSTAIGAVPIFFSTYSSKKMMDVLLGFAAGVMLAASCFSLIIPSIEIGGGNTSAVFITALGIFIGGIIIDLIDKFVPHEHLISHREEGRNRDRLKKSGCLSWRSPYTTFRKDLRSASASGAETFQRDCRSLSELHCKIFRKVLPWHLH